MNSKSKNYFCAVTKLWGFPVPWGVLSAIQTHAGALIQVHVGITEETFGNTFHLSRHLIGQLCGRHFQVPANLGAVLNLRDVESISLSWTQRTAEPVSTQTVHEWEITQKQTTHLLCRPCCQKRSSLGCLVRIWWRTHSGWSRCRAQQTTLVCPWSGSEELHESRNLRECPEELADGSAVEDESAPREKHAVWAATKDYFHMNIQRMFGNFLFNILMCLI